MKKIMILLAIISTIVIATLDCNARTASTADYRIEHADGTITLIW